MQSVHRVEGFLETAGMRLFRFRQRFEPVGAFVETFLAGGFRHARIHVRVFVGFAGNRRFQVGVGRANRLAGCRITGFFEELEVTVRVARFAFGGGTENGGDIVVAFNISLLGSLKITPTIPTKGLPIFWMEIFKARQKRITI